MSAGKGSSPRPFDVPRAVYEDNHDRIFGKRERVQYIPPPLPKPDLPLDREKELEQN